MTGAVRRRRRAQPREDGALERLAALDSTVTLRRAEPRDDGALERLAALDSALALVAPLLVADLDGELLAAISLADGAVIADPFRPTAALVELLRARERQLHAARRPRRVPAWVRRRVPAIG